MDRSRRFDNRNEGTSDCVPICAIYHFTIYSEQGGSNMLSYKNTKNANFLFIVAMLKELLAQEVITDKEYARAKKYYLKLTGADIILAS